MSRSQDIFDDDEKLADRDNDGPLGTSENVDAGECAVGSEARVTLDETLESDLEGGRGARGFLGQLLVTGPFFSFLRLFGLNL